MKVCLAPTRVLACPELGGHAWAYLNWTLGLEENGCDVVWIERLPPDVGPHRAVELVRALRARIASAGARARIAIVPETARGLAPPLDDLLAAETVPLDEAAAGADLLLDFHYETEPDLLAKFPRTALVDIDPGIFQHWMHSGQLRVAEHDLWFTIGETVGTPAARFPDCGRKWIHTPPAVSLAAWETRAAPAGAPFTSVSSWAREWQVTDGVAYPDDKRTAFLEFAELPRMTRAPLGLALTLTAADCDRADRAALVAAGWSVRDARAACATPEDYRWFVRASAGEFSCAKPSYVRFETAWVSDRTLCYLATGRPAVVQHTGASRFLPDAEGLLRFRTPREAAAALDAVLAEPARHARAARALAEEHFDARRVARRVLERALASPARDRRTAGCGKR